MTRRTALSGSLAAAVAPAAMPAGALAQAAPAAPALLTRPNGAPVSDRPLFGAVTWTLGNGLRVVLAESRRVPVAAHYLFYGAGAGEDPAGRLGLAPEHQAVDQALVGALQPQALLVDAAADVAVHRAAGLAEQRRLTLRGAGGRGAEHGAGHQRRLGRLALAHLLRAAGPRTGRRQVVQRGRHGQRRPGGDLELVRRVAGEAEGARGVGAAGAEQQQHRQRGDPRGDAEATEVHRG